MEYCSSVLCLHPIRQSLYMGLMGCTACGGISYPPCTNGLHDVKNTLENAWLNTDNSQTFGLYVHYRGLKRHPQIKCSLQGNKNIEVPTSQKSDFMVTRNYLDFLRLILGLLSLFCQSYMIHKKNRFRLIGRSSYYQILKWHKIGQVFLWNRLQKRAGR